MELFIVSDSPDDHAHFSLGLIAIALYKKKV